MAFQTGTRVNPQLGALDFSGFTNAAKIQAASLASLGEAMSNAIEKHQEKKIKKQQDAVTRKALESLFPDLDDDTITAVMKDEVFRDLFKTTLDNEADPTTATQMTSIGRLLERPEFSNIKFDESGEPFMEIPNKDTLMPFDKKRIPVPESITSIPGFEDYAKSRRTSAVPEVNDNDPMGIF